MTPSAPWKSAVRKARQVRAEAFPHHHPPFRVWGWGAGASGIESQGTGSLLAQENPQHD